MQFPDKSNEQAPPKKKIEAVAKGVTQVKRPASRRFKDYIFAESPKDLAKKVASDVVVPRVKAGVEEAIQSFLSGMLWGGNRPTSSMINRGGQIVRAGGVNYSGISTAQSGLAQARIATGQTLGSYEDLACPDRQTAEAILANMFELLNDYRRVAVGDLYDLAGITSNDPMINSYGWNSLEGAQVTPRGGSFILELPRPVIIK